MQQTSDPLKIGAAGPSRLKSLLQQLDKAGIQIFAFQETRLRHFHCRKDPTYILVNAPATAAGHLGIMIGLHCLRPHGTDSTGLKQFFNDSHYAIIDSGPRKLIVRIKSPVRCILIAAHAPHQGSELEDINKFWKDLTRALPKKYADWPILLLADANCRVGQVEDDFIGGWQAECDSEKAEPFQHFVRYHNLRLPATFEVSQSGPSGTWQHAQGGWSRIAFVGLPREWNLEHCRARVDTEVDLSLQRENHRLATVEFSFRTALSTCHRSSRTCKYQATDIDWDAVRQMGMQQWINPDQDVHTHAAEIQDALLSICKDKRNQNQNQKVPRKTTMSEYTWELVQEKRFWRNHLAQLHRHQRIHLLSGIFALWKNHKQSEATPGTVEMLDATLKQYDKPIAEALFYFRALGRRVTEAMRKDDKAFFATLASETGTLLSPDNAKRFWGVLRRSMPKFRQRRASLPPMRIEALEDRWEPCFHDLESGYSQTLEQIVAACHQSQMEQPVVQTTFQITDLPTLFELEDKIRQTTPDRSTGFDPLPSALYHHAATPLAALHYGITLKTFLWQSEPVCNKGGLLTVISCRQWQNALMR